MSEVKPGGLWSKIKLVVEVVEVRLRFVVVLLLVGLFIVYWETIQNYWDKWTRPAVASKTLGDKEFYCPMHPKVIRHELEPDGSIPKCPICGMPLSPRAAQGEGEPLPPGVTARVQISPERIELAGIQTEEVAYRPLVRHISTIGTVAYDESRLANVVTRTGGYVEKLYVDKTYLQVKQGDPLAEIYSPDLYSTSQELLVASKDPATADMAASARRRLKLFGVSPREIDELVSSGHAMPRLVIRSPRSGLVIRKNVVAGARVDEGMTLLEVADLGQVWIEADVYEQDIALVAAGQAVEARVEAWPERSFAGKVALVYPQLDTATRTNRVRFQVANADYRLRPGMFATVEISTPQVTHDKGDRSMFLADGSPKIEGPGAEKGTSPRGEVLAVPERAVVDTGAKQIVYVERKPGTFEGVEVQLGPRNGEFYPVLKGLAAGQRIAAAGAFLVDAETRLNPAAAATFFGASGGPALASNRTVRPAAGAMGSGATAGLSSSAPGTSQEDTAGQASSGTRQAGRSQGDSPIFVERKLGQSPPTPAALANLANLAKLPAGDRLIALAQGICPVTGAALGSMGVPQKVSLQGHTIFLCCPGCVEEANAKPQEMLAKVATFKAARSAGQEKAK